MPSKSAITASIATRIASADARARLLAPMIAEIQDAGVRSFNGIAQQLNERGSTTYRGKAWSDVQVRRVLTRLKEL